MKNYIIGSGGFAKEVYWILKRNNLDCCGFIDLSNGYKIIDDKKIPIYEESKFLNDLQKNVALYIGIGNPTILSKVKKDYSSFYFPNLIDPKANLLGTVNMGYGNIFCCNSIFTDDIQIGSYNIFTVGVSIGHDVTIGDCNVFNPTSCISGNVSIKNENLFGVNCTVLQNLKINSQNKIGANALITKSIETSGIYVGIPAKKKD